MRIFSHALSAETVPERNTYFLKLTGTAGALSARKPSWSKKPCSLGRMTLLLRFFN